MQAPAISANANIETMEWSDILEVLCERIVVISWWKIFRLTTMANGKPTNRQRPKENFND